MALFISERCLGTLPRLIEKFWHSTHVGGLTTTDNSPIRKAKVAAGGDQQRRPNSECGFKCNSPLCTTEIVEASQAALSVQNDFLLASVCKSCKWSYDVQQLVSSIRQSTVTSGIRSVAPPPSLRPRSRHWRQWNRRNCIKCRRRARAARRLRGVEGCIETSPVW